jgi:hypothetical protein
MLAAIIFVDLAVHFYCMFIITPCDPNKLSNALDKFIW